MIDPDKLSPMEVSAHLSQLGYQNISSPQLREFTHDLKKLIKYEQKCRQGLRESFDSNDSHVTSERSSRILRKINKCSSGRDSSSTSSSELCTNCNLTKTNSDCDIIQSVPSSSSMDYAKRKMESYDPSFRAQSSFIRPWRLQNSMKSHTSSSLKSDPVQLYHRYKELWTQQKVPGEKSHSQLRWTIREKMLGQDPQPRPISQASADHRNKSLSCK